MWTAKLTLLSIPPIYPTYTSDKPKGRLDLRCRVSGIEDDGRGEMTGENEYAVMLDAGSGG